MKYLLLFLLIPLFFYSCLENGLKNSKPEWGLMKITTTGFAVNWLGKEEWTVGIIIAAQDQNKLNDVVRLGRILGEKGDTIKIYWKYFEALNEYNWTIK